MSRRQASDRGPDQARDRFRGARPPLRPSAFWPLARGAGGPLGLALGAFCLGLLACAGPAANPKIASAAPAPPPPVPAGALESGAPPAAEAPSAPAQATPPVAERTGPVTAARLEAHVRFLAADELAGRATGSEGAVRAGHYLAEQLSAAGLEPAGDEGTFLQHLDFGTREYSGLPRMWCRGPEGEFEATYGVDFDGLVGLPGGGDLRIRVCREPDDLGEPDPGTALFLVGNSRERAAWLEGREGDGLVLWAGSRRPGKAQTRPPRTLRWTGPGPSKAPGLRLRGPLAERVEAGEVESLRLEARVEDRRPPAFNVVGRLPGRGELAEEVVVYTAHYDHIGLKRPAAPAPGETAPDEPEDLIHNGADDDASGCAAVLELARVLALEAERSDAPASPGATGAADTQRRTQLFLLVTGEEIGLVGTFAYIEDPVEPLERTVCNLNFEMIGRPDALVGGAGKLWLTGFERTNLGPAFAAEGIEVAVDPRPEERFFLRSDNIAFARIGIVAQSLSSYDLHADYHHVTDEVETLDFGHMETCVRTALEAARALADGRVDPAWEPGGAPESR